MPELDGISLLRFALEIDPDLVGVIMTGHGTIETAVEAMKTGALDFILKPFEPGDVLRVLTRALGIRRLRLENSDLQRCLRERTIQLENANRELDSFTHSVSHDLRAPLRAIGGFSNVLVRDFAPQLPHEARRVINIIVSSANEMTKMIDAVLEFCRLGRQSIAMEPVDLTPLVKRVVDNLRDQQNHQTEIKVANLPRCSGDPVLLEQVFVNLLSNAFKFTGNTERPVVEIGWQGGNGEHTYFVRDNGVGFDMQYAERLFGVFQRLHSEQEFEGHGVGLSIVQRIIHRHGGRIWAQAEVDKGATFFFTLPNSTPPDGTVG
jgi:light-regulated signal transduction histidine kinase (bacteriophytochrome)